MDPEIQLYLRLPVEPNATDDTLTIPMAEDDTNIVVLSQRERISVPFPKRREVSLEEIADHHHFSFLTLDGKIGMGGLAAVYRMMTETHLGFALKVPLKVTAKTYDHFALEAHLLRDLRRKNAPVPELVSHGIAVAFPYVLMDDLGMDFLKSTNTHHGNHVLAEKVSRVGLRVCDALQALHELGYRHNDVKPANIHYALSGDIHLLDFASATPLDSSLDSQAFSPRYLAPERLIDGFPVNEKVDVFGLGLVLYELLADHPAFMTTQDPNTIPGLREHVHLVKTRGYAPLTGYSPWITSLVRSMIEYDPTGRPPLSVVREELLAVRREYFE